MPTLPVAAKPEDAGVDSARLQALFARAKQEVDAGNIPGCQVALGRNGVLAGSATFGSSRHGEAERPVTDDTLYTIFSSTKGVVSVAAWQLLEQGKIRLEDKVADHIPEFKTNGKDVVTIEQALLHIGGFPQAPLGPPKWATREGRREAFARWRLTYEPGTKFEYHASSLHWVVVDLVERHTGMEWHQYLRECLIAPLGLQDHLYIGLPRELNQRVADIYYVTEPTPPPGGWGEVTPYAILRFNDPGQREIGIPGGGGIGTAGALALFYQALVNGGASHDGNRILKPETIDMAIIPRTDDRHVDLLWGKPINRSLGMMVAGDRENMPYRGFGTACSERAFGHAGAGGQLAWGDPESGISLGFTTNGFAGEIEMRDRTRDLSTLAAQCAI
ncbi:MAG: serine hydrolase domain-containing protein [Dehalococcoidia bacterium]|nr:beta-lactamase family protein [Dehalococcoidia bacterium]MCB9486526.1 beta-lactamase family protein [Thermoflexaceae bacterium]